MLYLENYIFNIFFYTLDRKLTFFYIEIHTFQSVLKSFSMRIITQKVEVTPFRRAVRRAVRRARGNSAPFTFLIVRRLLHHNYYMQMNCDNHCIQYEGLIIVLTFETLQFFF